MSRRLRGLSNHKKHVLRRISSRSDGFLCGWQWRSAALSGPKTPRPALDDLRNHQFRWRLWKARKIWHLRSHSQLCALDSTSHEAVRVRGRILSQKTNCRVRDNRLMSCFVTHLSANFIILYTILFFVIKNDGFQLKRNSVSFILVLHFIIKCFYSTWHTLDQNFKKKLKCQNSKVKINKWL